MNWNPMSTCLSIITPMFVIFGNVTYLNFFYIQVKDFIMKLGIKQYRDVEG
jgi:hypothetical protein